MSDTVEHVVIVGAGHASGQAVQSLRMEGFEGKITLIGEEPYYPYQRPPLSKKFLSGEIGINRVEFKPQDYYGADQANAEIKLNTVVTKIDRDAKTVETAEGETICYDKLIITTGSRVRKLDFLPGADLNGIFYLRTIDDVEGIKKYFGGGKKCVIVGAGYIGLEVAAVAVKHDVDVTVLETEERVMSRVTAPVMSKFYDRIHREEGVKIEYGVKATGFEGEGGEVKRVTTEGGDSFDADFVVIGVGIIPNVELAAEAGLEVDNGIVVNELTQTSDPDIYSAGDCTNHPNPLLGIKLRLESVQNALEQAKVAAAHICGKEKPYAQVPWFWSDQYDLKLQIAGLSQGHDQVVLRGNPDEGRSFAAFYLKDGVLIAVDAVNAAPEFLMSKKLIAQKAAIAPEKLQDTSIPMKEMV